ncbi:hypothetical protein F2Q70_00038347 [Brassica cretica]|uniref:Uncharacterized protein n=1 Tax=Brassica cretica TaxID=69181 RepID=A0A8S9K1E4_BRACR|nr:hypothetical protein F2Q70_00038347 [Brassica cretica]
MQGLSNKYLDLQITATKSRSSSFCWNPYEASLNGCSLHSGELGFLLAGILGTRVPSSGDPEAGVLPGAGLRSSNPAIPGSTQDGELWASDGVLEMMEPRALTFSQEELA